MNRLNANLTPEQRRERARQNREWRQSAARRYEDSQREDPDVGKYRDIGPNRERQKKRREEGKVYGPYHRWIGTLGCVVAQYCPSHNCWGPVAGHHLKRVGAGGEDYGNEVPMCRKAHDQCHAQGDARVESAYQIDLSAAAREYAEAWKEKQG